MEHPQRDSNPCRHLERKEILLEIYREVRWIGRFLAVLGVLAIVAIGAAILVSA